MALRNENKKIIMDEGDYGLDMLFSLNGEDIEENDIVKFTIKTNPYAKNVYQKDYNLIKQNDKYTFILNFTKEESELLKADCYHYGIKLYRNGKLLNTLIRDEKFIVNKGV